MTVKLTRRRLTRTDPFRRSGILRVADYTSNRSQQFGKCHSARPDCVFGRLGAIQTR